MSATRKQPSRANKGGSSAGVRTSPGEQRTEQPASTSSQRKAAANSPQASIIQRERGQTTQTQTQGQRARRRPSRSSTSQQQQLVSNNNNNINISNNNNNNSNNNNNNNTTKSSKAAAPPSAAYPLPPPSSVTTTTTNTTATTATTATNIINPLPLSTTPSTTTVKRTLDVAPPTVGPKGIMHDKMVHVSFQPVPETPTSAPPSNRATRAQKREERQQHQRSSQPMEDEETDSDSSSPRVKGIFDHPLLPPKKPRRKHKPTTSSTKNPSDPAPSSVQNAMDLDLKSAAQQAPPTPLSAQPLPSPSQGAGSSYWSQPWVCATHLLARHVATSPLS